MTVHTMVGNSEMELKSCPGQLHESDTCLGALRRSGVLADMAAHGVEAVDCCSVDNVLAPLGDPVFAGHCLSQGAECGGGFSQSKSPACSHGN